MSRRRRTARRHCGGEATAGRLTIISDLDTLRFDPLCRPEPESLALKLPDQAPGAGRRVAVDRHPGRGRRRRGEPV